MIIALIHLSFKKKSEIIADRNKIFPTSTYEKKEIYNVDPILLLKFNHYKARIPILHKVII